jgi:hypothetical protein
MHRVIGDAVMSALAFAAAQARGMRLVTEFPDLYAQTIKRPIGEIFRALPCVLSASGRPPLATKASYSQRRSYSDIVISRDWMREAWRC